MSSKLQIKLDLYPALKNSNIQQTQKNYTDITATLWKMLNVISECGFFSYELLMCVFPISDERELVNRLNDSIIDF